MAISRREFLRRGAGGVTLAAASACMPTILARTARAACAAEPDGAILVLVQLTGGNDGLNTVVPFRDDVYRRSRPTLALSDREVMRLTDDVGLAPQLAPLREMYDEGWLGVVQNVGYPNPNRSHFESMDIWHCADPTRSERRNGWLGRAMRHAPELSALHLDDTALPLALRGDGVDVPSVSSLESFRLPGAGHTATQEAIAAAIEAACAGATAAAREAEYVRRTAVEACRHARRIQALGDGDSGSYPGFGLAQRLRDIAKLIGADLGPRVYYTSLGGFDTHARQKTVHPDLLSELGQSVKAFFDDLKAQGVAERVVLLTFSEFGRRVSENGSLGTDHGAAAPLFVIGPRARAGVHGAAPDLASLVDGDVAHRVDFRSVYAGLLQDWLKLDAAKIIGPAFSPLPLVRG